MIQCVAQDGKLSMSRICCTNTLKNALRLKMLNPECQVVVLYKNIITYGFRARSTTSGAAPGRRLRALHRPGTARRAPGAARRSAGPGRAHPGTHVAARWSSSPTCSRSPRPSCRRLRPPALATMLDVPLSAEGFFLEAHLKMRPMEFADDGMLLAGMAHYPKFIEEFITHALACAGRALTILTRPTLELGGVVAEIDPDKCVGCLTCARPAPSTFRRFVPTSTESAASGARPGSIPPAARAAAPARPSAPPGPSNSSTSPMPRSAWPSGAGRSPRRCLPQAEEPTWSTCRRISWR